MVATALVCVASTGTAWPTAHEECTYALARAKSASPGRFSNDLAGVDAKGNAAWAAGSFAQTVRGPFRPLLEHWSGSAWSAVRLPSLGKESFSFFSDVAVVSRSNVWAVGQVSARVRSTRPLVEHWTGSRARIVATPSLGKYATLNGIAAVSAADMWAVGYRRDRRQRATPLVEHWNGKSWRVAATPRITNGELMRVAAASRSDVWAVGFRNAPDTEALIEHWNGHTWTIVPPDTSTHLQALLDVAVSPAGEVWAVGTADPGIPAAQRWDGSGWASVSLPTSDGLLSAASAPASGDVWAVGWHRGAQPEFQQPLALHWNGTEWETIPAENPSPTYTVFFDVAVSGPGRAWAVGAYDADAGPEKPSRVKTLVEASAVCA